MSSNELRKEQTMNTESKEKKMFTEVTPVADIVEENDKATVYFEVPGTNSKQVKIEVKNSTLTIEAESYLERHGKPILFKRSFELSDAVDVDNIKAKNQDGVLILTLPKAESAQVKKIAVE
jgi:HSP20 family molecular chaperone IbpA